MNLDEFSETSVSRSTAPIWVLPTILGGIVWAVIFSTFSGAILAIRPYSDGAESIAPTIVTLLFPVGDIANFWVGIARAAAAVSAGDVAGIGAGILVGALFAMPFGIIHYTIVVFILGGLARAVRKLAALRME